MLWPGIAAAFLALSSLSAQSYHSLEVRIYNQTGKLDSEISLLGIGTGTNDLNASQFSMYYTNSTGTVNLTNRAQTNPALVPNTPLSVILTNLPRGSNSLGSYRSMYVDYVESGLMVFGLTTNAYSNTTNNPNSTQAGDSPGDWGGVIWNQAELSYTGSQYDTIDVTAINQVGIPMLLQMMTNVAAPAPISNGTKGYTNTNNIQKMLSLLNTTPGAPWFFAAPQTNTANWLGPSTAAKPSLIMPICQNTNFSNTVIWQAGWPGAVTPTFAPYVKSVFTNVPMGGTNSNGTKVFAKIQGTIGLPNGKRTTNTNSGATIYSYQFDLTLLPNSTPNSLYSTPTPVLTNGVVIVEVTGPLPSTNTNTGLWIRYTPDQGSPTNSWFSSYIYQAPSSYLDGASTNSANRPSGFVTWSTNWTNLATNYDFNWYYFVANVFDSMANDIAFGFAGGFVNSSVPGSYVNTLSNTVNSNIGAMPSYGWWQQTKLYSDLQPSSPPGWSNSYYSAYGDAIYQCSSLVYSHPISDRMTNSGLAPGLSLVTANTNSNSFLAITLLPVKVSGSSGVPTFSSNPNFITLTNTNLFWSNTPQVLQYTNTNQSSGVNIIISGIGASNNPLWLAADGLPPGLVFSSTGPAGGPITGSITGTVPFGTSGQYVIRLQAANSNGTALAALALNIIGPPKNTGKPKIVGGPTFPYASSNPPPGFPTNTYNFLIVQNSGYSNASAAVQFGTVNTLNTVFTSTNLPPGITLSTNFTPDGMPNPVLIGTNTSPVLPLNTTSNWAIDIVLSNTTWGSTTSRVCAVLTNSGATPTFNNGPPQWTGPNQNRGSAPVYIQLVQSNTYKAGSTAPQLTGTNTWNSAILSVSNLPPGVGYLASNSLVANKTLVCAITGTPTQTTWSYTNTNKTVNVTFVLSNSIGTTNQVVPFEVMPKTQPSSQTSPVLSWVGSAQSPVYVNQPIPTNNSGATYGGKPMYGAYLEGSGLWNAQWATPTNLPPGLYFTMLEQQGGGDENWGAIYGIPITLTTNTVTFIVTNRYGVTTTNFSIGTFPTNAVNPSNPPYNPGPLSNVTTAPGFTGPFTATSGTNENVEWPLDVSNYPSVFGVGVGPDELPPGLILVAEWDDANLLFNLAVTGRPTTVGVYSSKVTAQNYWGTTTNTYTLTITGAVAPTAPQFTWKTNVLVGTQSSPVLFPLHLQGTRPIRLTNSPALPLKLVLAQDQNSNWLVSGTPTIGGTNTVSLTASNEAGSTTTNLVLRIAWLTPPAPQINPPYKASGTSGVAFNFQVNAINTTNYSGASLPAGLSINATNGLISGTNFGPTTVTTSTITVNGAGGQAQTNLVLTITNTNVAPTFTSTNQATGQVGVAFLFTNTASGTAPITFGETRLPAGLSLVTATGVITGTPTASGTNSWTITASNAGGVTNQALSLAIASVTPGPKPSSISPSSASATQGVAFSLQMTASNNPTNWSAVGMPVNLTINQSGLITGTPQTNGTNAVRLTAVNSNGSGEGGLTLVVRPTVPVFTSTNRVTGKQGQALNFTVTATSSAAATYSAMGLPGNLQINPSSGLISSPNVNTNGTFTSTITASNWGTAGTQSLVFVLDTALPVFTSTNVVTGTQGVALIPFQATVSNGPASFTQTGLTTNYTFSSSGLLTGTPTQAGTNTVNLYASNSFGTTSQSLQLRIAPAPPTPAPVFTSSNAVTRTSGVAFNFTVSASNATNYTAAPLPLGLSMNLTSGLISGTNVGPTAVTTSTVTARGAGGVTNQQLRITITNTNVAPTFTSTNQATGQVGVAFLFTNTASGTAPITFGETRLPAGLSLVTATGVITGTPTASGTNSWTITASNAGGVTNQALSLAIASVTPGPKPSSISPSSASATQGVAFSLQMTASNNPTNWSAVGMPVNLTINQSGLITGTPQTNGTNAVRLTAVNSNGSGEGGLTLVVRPTVPVFTSTNVIRGTQNQPLDFQVEATSSANVTYSAMGLPVNLTIRSDGLITGTPQTNGTFGASIVASTWGTSATQALRLVISPASSGPVITSALTASATQGMPFQYRITATGAPTITYGASPLPGGLGINLGTGLISGRPTTNGVFPVQMTAGNGSGTNVQTLVLTIASDSSRAPIIYSSTLTFGRQNTAFSYTILASNRPTSYGASGLPNGLTVNPASGVISGKPVINGVFTPTVTASNAAGIGSRMVRFIIAIP